MSNKLKYFILAVIIFGTAGIWLPLSIELLWGEGNVKLSDLIQNTTTYFIAILFGGCIDYYYKIIEELKVINKNKLFGKFLNMIFILTLGAFLVLVIVITNSKGIYCVALLGLLVALTISYILWWNSNKKMEFPDPTEALGGNPENDLING